MIEHPPHHAKGLHRIVEDITGFAGSQYFVRFASLLKGFIVARVLGPEGNGLWQHFVLISEYCQHVQLGALPGLNKLFGRRVGEGDEERTRLASETGTGAAFFSALILWAGLLVYVAIRYRSLAPWDRFGLPILGFIVVMDQVNFTYMALLRAYSRIRLISLLATVFAASNLVVSLSLLPSLGILGLLLGWALTRAATTVALVKKSGFGFRPFVDGPTLGILVATGFPIFLFHLTRAGLGNIDRVLVDLVLEPEELGIYGIAVTLAGFVRYAAEAVGFVVYPIFLRSYGATSDPRTLREHLVQPTNFLAVSIPIALGFGSLVLHVPLLWFLPEFARSVEIFRLLCVAMAFSCLSILPGFYLMAIDRQNALIPVGAVALAFDWFVGREAIARGFGLAGVAATMGAGSLAYTAIVLAYAARFAMGSSLAGIGWVIRSYGSVAFVAALALLVGWGGRTILVGWGETAKALVEGGVFLLVTAPLLVAFERRTGFLDRLRRGRAQHSDTLGGAVS
jgi:O-antigen/teichoic acid export membrane protein